MEAGEITRPMIELYQDGEKRLCEYDLVKIFEDKEEAKAYAKRNTLHL